MHADARTPPARPGVDDMAACRRLMRGGSKSFFAASLLLPARVRAPATALYAFCRLADDAIDLGTDSAAAMHALRQRLDAIYDGRPQPIDADRALACVVHAHGVPRAPLDALLEGFLWDGCGRRYDSIADLEDYAARVAGTVGAMMALVMGAQSARALARACELGVAMQFTNIARDVGEDARNGRLYLPRQWMREAGIDPDAWLRAPSFDERLASVVRRLLDAAELLYARSEHGIAALPRDCRPAIRAARLVYAEIGHELARRGLDSVNSRAVVSQRRKLALMARAAGAAIVQPGRADVTLAPLPAIAFLVDACAGPEVQGMATSASRSFDDRVVWLIDLFERQATPRSLVR
jgi:phytoene synthase